MIIDKIKEEKESQAVTNQELSDQSGVPIGTIARIMARSADGANYTTVIALCRALHISVDEFEGIETDGKPVAQNDRRIFWYMERIMGTKDRWIRTLFFCCFGLVAVVVFLLIFDIVNPYIGYVRY